MEEKIVPDGILYTDSPGSYNVLDISTFHNLHISYSEKFADGRNHINSIENFWNQTKRHMRRFNGIPKEHFNLFLKEYEWRFNSPDPKQQVLLLKELIKGQLN